VLAAPWRKRRNKKPIKALKTNVSATSGDFVPNDFNGLPLRIVSLGAIFPSFGAKPFALGRLA